MASTYTFGDGDLALRRLDLLAEVYGPSSRALLAEVVPAGAATALDLGCGPGHTTRMVAEACRPARTIGVDVSARCVDHARATVGRGRPGISFVAHDVTAVPLPGAPADLIYARLLLAHLPDPLAVVARWRTQLAPGGVLVLEEVEAIDPPPGVLADYERLVTALVADGGGTMAVGPALGAALGGATVDVPVDVVDAARMFGLNLATWGDSAVGQGLVTAVEVDRLARELAALAATGRGTATVRWVLRQISAGPA